MTPERYQQITRLHQAALELTLSQRQAFLAQACAGDDELRREVESLLEHDAESDGFLAAPALNVAARLLALEQRTKAAGERISHYEVLSLLGTGGMGEVYLAEDTRLYRKVAVKLLPAAYTRDAERLQRFKQEAQTASALNHPNLLTVHDIGENEGLHYIVTEFVEGQTLRQLLQAGPLPLASVIDIAAQIADALVAAHKAGIIHRDLKPENIMRRPDGYVKVLDFGLAKLTERGTGAELTGRSARHTPHLTEPGKVMGTISYMSPEQALGQAVDWRSDLFSLGVVLYEMLTGVQPFSGTTDASIYDGILHRTPKPLRELAPQLPAELEWIINRLLEKEVGLRYQSASDLRAALLTLKRNSSSGAVAISPAGVAPGQHASQRLSVPRTWLPKVAAGVLTLSALAGLWWWQARKTAPFATAMKPLSFTRLTGQPGRELYPSLSPDGKQLVYAGEEAGNLDIWLQRVGGTTAINLTRDSLAEDTQPAFSPDGEQILFRSDRDGGGIFLMGATGENVRRLVRQGYDPAWSPDGQEIIYATGFFTDVPGDRSGHPSSLHIVNVQTGATRQLTTEDAVQPSWSPHGQRIAYWGMPLGGQRDLWTIAVQGGTPTRITNDAAVDWNPIWSPDGNYLYFASDRGGSMNLWRVPIEEASGRVLGAPEPVTTPATYSGYLSFARDGRRLAYAEASYQVNLEEVAFDPVKKRVFGDPRWITRGARIAVQQHISPDQQWIVFNSLGDRQEDLFVIRRDGTGLRQLTNDPYKDRAPRWSPDGQRIIFFSDRKGLYELWEINPDGGDLRKLTEVTGVDVQMSVWSPDGRTIACSLDYPRPPFLLNPALPWAQQTVQSLPAPNNTGGMLVTSWSPDGQKLIGHRKGIVTYSFATQQYQRLTDFGQIPCWLNDSRHAVFYDEEQVHLIDTQTQQVAGIYSVAPRRLQFVSVSPDNRFLILSINTTEADIWLATLPE